MLTKRTATTRPLSTPESASAVLSVLVVGAAVCVLALVAMLAPAAQAAPGWSAPAELSAPGHTGFEQHVAIDPRGNAVAVWQRSNGTVSVIQAATRRAGGATWSAPVDLSGDEASGELPRVAIDAAGEAVATWEESYSVNTVQVATLSPTGAWSAPLTLSETGRNSSDPKVAMSPAGEAVVVWAGADSAGAAIAQEATRPAGAAWTIPVKLSAEGQNAELPAVAIDPSGATVVAWSRNDGSNFIVQEKSRPPGGIWGFTANLSKPGGGAGAPSVAIDPAGDAVVSWQRYDGSHEVVQAARRTGETGPWSAPVDLSRAEEAGWSSVAALDDAGDATVGWEALYGNSHLVAVAESAAGSSAWSAPTVLSGAGETGFEPALAVDPRGDAIAAWTTRTPGAEVLQAARRVAGAWSVPVDLSPTGTENKAAAVAIDEWGDAVTAWRHWDGADSIVAASSLDAPRPAPEPGPGVDPAPGSTSGSGAATPPSAAPVPGASPTSPPPSTTSAKPRCPRGKTLRKVKVSAHGKGKARSKTVTKCVRAAPHHQKHANHQTKGN